MQLLIDVWSAGTRRARLVLRRRASGALALVSLVALSACGISEREEREMGSAEAASIDSQVPIVDDVEISQFVTGLGQSLASQSNRADADWRFTVINVWPVNAFALPGGYVYVTRGLIEQSERLEEVAGVMGHEIAHIAQRHSVKQMQAGEKQEAGVTLLCTLTGLCRTLGGAVAIQIGVEAQSAQYSQQHETEADAIGVQITSRAGIDPEGLPRFLEKMLASRVEQPTPLEAFFASHPTDEKRIATLRREIDALNLSESAPLTRDTPAYQAFRDRVRALPTPPPPWDTLGAPKPPH